MPFSLAAVDRSVDGDNDYLFAGGVVLLPLVLGFETAVPDLAGSVVVGSGAVLPGAVPDGVFGDIVLLPLAPDGELGDPIVLVVPDGVDASPDVDVPDEPLLIAPEVEPPVVPDVPSVPVPGVDDVVAVLPVVLVVDGFDIVLSVFGVSFLLQAPSAARVAAIATHLIELRMFSPRLGVHAGCGTRRDARVGRGRIALSAIR